jgi:hypothetical protein
MEHLHLELRRTESRRQPEEDEQEKCNPRPLGFPSDLLVLLFICHINLPFA